MGALGDYVTTLCERFGQGWNRFWYTPRDPFGLAVMRVLVGLMALWVVGSYTFDLERLFGPDGILPVELVQRLRPPGQWSFSYLDSCRSATDLQVAHALGLVALAAFTAGLFTRVTSILSLVVVLSYVQRAPQLTGEMEPIVTMMLAYLCLAPIGACLSVDALLARRKKPDLTRTAVGPQEGFSAAANVVTRLIQVHLAAVYLMMGVAKLAEAGDAWWMGQAVWWLAARPESRLIDLTGLLYDHPYVVNAWSHAIVAFELLFALLIWNRLARPLLLAVAVPMWVALALVSGLVGFCLAMLVAGVAFFPPAMLRAWLRRPLVPATMA